MKIISFLVSALLVGTCCGIAVLVDTFVSSDLRLLQSYRLCLGFNNVKLGTYD